MCGFGCVIAFSWIQHMLSQHTASTILPRQAMSKHVNGQQQIRRPAGNNRLAKKHRVVKRSYNNGLPPRIPATRNTSRMSITKWYGRIRALRADFLAALGGIDNVSPQELALLNRTITLITECERREVGFARAAMIDDDALCVYQTATNSLRRTLESLGLKRRTRDVTPSLSDIIREHEQQDDTAAASTEAAPP
jgi:hypothetical protein